MKKTKKSGKNKKTDFSKFSDFDREFAKELFDAWEKTGLPEDFVEDNVEILFQTNSFCVFLTNSESQIAMLNGDRIERYYVNHRTCEEGFKRDLSKEALERLGLK